MTLFSRAIVKLVCSISMSSNVVATGHIRLLCTRNVAEFYVSLKLYINNSQLCLMTNILDRADLLQYKTFTVLIFSQYWDKTIKYNLLKQYEKHNIIHTVVKGR